MRTFCDNGHLRVSVSESDIYFECLNKSDPILKKCRGMTITFNDIGVVVNLESRGVDCKEFKNSPLFDGLVKRAWAYAVERANSGRVAGYTSKMPPS